MYPEYTPVNDCLQVVGVKTHVNKRTDIMEIISECKDRDFKCLLVSKNDEVWSDLMKLRTNTWNQPGWENVPDGEFEIDQYDHRSTHFAVTYMGEVIGCFRLISASYITQLPFAEYCAPGTLPNEKTPIEISRWCTNKAFPGEVRKEAHSFMLLALHEYLYSVHIDSAYMDVCSELHKYLSRKLVVESLGDSHTRGVQNFTPVVLDVTGSLMKLNSSFFIPPVADKAVLVAA